MPFSQFALGQEAISQGAFESKAELPLEGLRFSARIVRSDKAGSDPNAGLGDTLTFRNGKFTSAICERFNFVPSPYWIRPDEDGLHFLAELNSPTDGKMIWNGTVRNGKLEGTMRWIRKRWYWTIDVEHNISGELKQGAAQNSSD